MSTPGSVRNAGDAAKYATPAGGVTSAPRKVRMFRWQGIVPLVLVGALVVAGWMLLGDRIVRGAVEEAGTKALGAQLDIADLNIRTFSTSVTIGGVALADPFNPNRNLLEIARIEMELEPRPLLQKKIVVRRLNIADVRTGTARAAPARPVSGGGFAPAALAEAKRFASQLNIPALVLAPLDSLKTLVLDPTRLKAVQAAVALGAAVDSVRQAAEQGFTSLRIQETVDSSAALVARMQSVNVRTLGLDGVRRAVADVRATAARVDSARVRLDRQLADMRRGVDTLQARARAIDDARRDDYAFARGLLQLPSIEGPDIGAALFGKVSLDRFEQAVYWLSLAQQYAPPGLLPREDPGPERLRRSGSTVRFVEPESYPRFMLRRADVDIAMPAAAAGGSYVFAASDLSTDPAISRKPMLFAIRRRGGAGLDSLLVTGSLDHTSDKSRDVVTARAGGVKLPAFALPVLPYSMDPGRGTAELRFVLNGDQLSGRWAVRSSNLTWVPDSSRARRLNNIELLVARALTGVKELDLTAEMSGTLAAPRMAIRSNLDRQVADRVRAVVGEEVARAQAKVRAEVDRLVEEKAAPVRARIADVRVEGERRVADARARLDEEKRKLEERLRALTGGLSLPRLPGT